MKKPDKIYAHRGLHLGILTTTVNKVDTPDEEEYIRKATILEWANNWKKLGLPEDFLYAMETLKLHLNSM